MRGGFLIGSTLFIRMSSLSCNNSVLVGIWEYMLIQGEGNGHDFKSDSTNSMIHVHVQTTAENSTNLFDISITISTR